MYVYIYIIYETHLFEAGRGDGLFEFIGVCSGNRRDGEFQRFAVHRDGNLPFGLREDIKEKTSGHRVHLLTLLLMLLLLLLLGLTLTPTLSG